MKIATTLLTFAACAVFTALSAPNGNRAAIGLERRVLPGSISTDAVLKKRDAIQKNQVKARDLRQSRTGTAKRATTSQTYMGACQTDSNCNGGVCNTQGMCQTAMTCTQTSQCTNMDYSNTPSVCKTSSSGFGGFGGSGGSSSGTCAYTAGETRNAPTTASPQGDRYSYSGCFSGYGSPVVTTSGATVSMTSSTLTPASCNQYCGNQGYPLAAVKNGNQCFCGNKYGPNASSGSGLSNSNSCTSTCSGASQQICGGSNSASAYQDVGQ